LSSKFIQINVTISKGSVKIFLYRLSRLTEINAPLLSLTIDLTGIVDKLKNAEGPGEPDRPAGIITHLAPQPLLRRKMHWLLSPLSGGFIIILTRCPARKR
jgi:hypothetical protein